MTVVFLAACGSSTGVTQHADDGTSQDMSGDAGEEPRPAEVKETVVEQCTPGEYTEAKNGRCYMCNPQGNGVVNQGEEIDDDDPCTDDECDPWLGVLHTTNDDPCDDGDPNTIEDMCVNGTCTGVEMTCVPGEFIQQGEECVKCMDGVKLAAIGIAIDDENPCTDDSCDTTNGVVHTPNSDPCDDGDPDTYNDTCVDGECLGSSQVCPPDEYFEMDGGCFLCSGDGLSYSEEGETVDDGNECTDDECDPLTGIAHTPNEGPCDDGDPDTTNDTCIDGLCEGVDIQCPPGKWEEDNGLCHLCNQDGTGFEPGGTVVDDSNLCTDELCDPAQGVVVTFNSDPCDDGNPETVGDMCDKGVCAGILLLCPPGLYFETEGTCALCNDEGTDLAQPGETLDDGDVCTDDICDPNAGATHVNNQAPCDDGDPGTGNDTCSQGACTGIPIACTPEKYVEDNGVCQLCDAEGFGYQGEGESIDDQDPCTDDTCEPAGGVKHAFNTAPCDDGTGCTEDDTCFNGACAGVVKTCEDENGCTDDTCQDGECVFTPTPDEPGCCDDSQDCLDPDACTEDVCTEYNCQHNVIDGCQQCQPNGLNNMCDDGDPCTCDVCMFLKCENIPFDADQVPGICQFPNECCTAASDCEDQNVCTDDACVDGLCASTFNNVPCEDGNPNTINDLCSAGQCAGEPIICPAGAYYQAGALCLLCNGDGTAPVGPGEATSDGNGCTNDLCDMAAGVTHQNNSAPCDDGDPNTANDMCSDGTCSGVPAIVCPADDYFEEEGICYLCNEQGNAVLGDGEVVDDNNVCTGEKCDEGDGVIRYFYNGDPCDDGSPDTVGDVCLDGVCVGEPEVCSPNDYFESNGLCYLCNAVGDGTVGNEVPVDDGNVCTDDICDEGNGVEHWNNSAACDDGDPDTVNDTCDDGVCTGEPLICPPGQWVAISQWWCQLCDETGAEWANSGVGTDDENDCTNDICDPQAGVVHMNKNGECWDFDPCTANDLCVDGQCLGTPVVCDDGEVCTQEECVPAQGGCVYTPMEGECDDGNPNTINDMCQDGLCIGVPAMQCPAGDYFGENGVCYLCNGDGNGIVDDGETIDDNNVCTGEACDPGDGVIRYFYNGNACDDGDPETSGDVCLGGECMGEPEVCPPNHYFESNGLCYLCNDMGDGAVGDGAQMDDGDPCTDDICDEGNGVEHWNNSAACDDGNPNTVNDTCEDGICAGEPMICPPGQWVAIDQWWCQLCDDTGADWANSGVGTDDENECTDDVCDPQAGVAHINNQVECWDFDPCTFNDFCVDGQCVGAAVVCDDGEVCTQEVCDADAGGCVYTPLGGECDDGDPDTVNDTCQDGVCVGTLVEFCPAGDYFEAQGLCYLCNGSGTGPVGAGDAIDDGNPCTDDECDAGNGVEHYSNSALCDDDDPGTVNDTCLDGACIGEPMICPPSQWVAIDQWWCQLCDDTGADWANSGVGTDDENDCTNDTCDPQAGVVHANTQGECWDSDPCTLDDVCVDGQCTGTPVVCDDKSVCTQEVCDSDAGGCVYTPVPGDCDDGVPLTTDDTCINGECIGMLDPDGDGIPNYGTGPLCDGPGLVQGCVDNCPYRKNAGQVDSNNDGYGDGCTGDVRVWMRVPTNAKVVALTFDDGWDNVALEEILNVLDDGGANGSFFLMGKYIDGGTLAPETLARLNNSGYVVGNHSYSGTAGSNQQECAAEIVACEQTFLGAGIPNPKPLFRLPSPQVTVPQWWVYPAMLQTGYSEQVLANFDTSDWEDVTPFADAMVQCVLDQVEPGDIISMHVGPEVTPAALPAMIEGLKSMGYSLLTIEQMLAFGEPEFFMDPTLIKTCKDYIE